MSGTRRLAVYVAAALLLTVVFAWAGTRWAAGRARVSTDRAAEALAHSEVGLLTSELQKFRVLPLVLAEHPDMAPAMRSDGVGTDARRRLNTTLELLARRTDAAAIYAVDRSGRTVAASNWRLPASFVGQNYGFRPYFAEAMNSGAAELCALGTVSGRAGLYLARRVERAGRPAGVIVIKVEFDAIEASWARAQAMTLAVDAHGVILVTSVPSWRFAATGPLSRATLADARRTLQFGPASPLLAPFRFVGPREVRRGDGLYRVAMVGAPLVGCWC